MFACRCFAKGFEVLPPDSGRRTLPHTILLSLAILSLAGAQILLATPPAGAVKSAGSARNQAAQNPPAPAKNPPAPAQPQNPPAAAQAESERTPIGPVDSVGEVYINDAKVPQVATLFYGDTLRTGAGGGATLNLVGKGVVTFSSNTVVSFNEVEYSGYFMTLKLGGLSFHSFINAKNFETLVGTYVVSPDSRGEAGGAIERHADDSAHIQCTLGQVGVISSEGPQSLYLNAGQEAFVLADGKLTTNKPAPYVPAGSTQPPGHNTKLWIILAGGGAAGAAIAIVEATKSSSPSNP